MASAALSGTLLTVSPVRESQIIAGGKTIIITLTDDTFVASGATFNAQRQAIINGIDSAGAGAAGWDAVVKAGLAVGDVARTSDTVCTITLPAFATYDITANEVITCTVPAAALTGNVALVATPTITVALDTPGFESITADDTAGGTYLSAKSYSYGYGTNQPQIAKRAVLYIETAAVRWTVNPNVTLTATLYGIPAAAASTITLEGPEQIVNFRAIRTTGTSATIHAIYYF